MARRCLRWIAAHFPHSCSSQFLCPCPQNSIKEARILESLSHPNIIAYLDSFIDDQDLMIVCEWAEVGATDALFRCWLSLQWMCIPGNKTYSLTSRTQIHTGWRSQVPGSQSAEQGHPLPRIHHMEIFPANCQRFVWCWYFLAQQDRNNQCSNPVEPTHVCTGHFSFCDILLQCVCDMFVRFSFFNIRGHDQLFRTN